MVTKAITSLRIGGSLARVGEQLVSGGDVDGVEWRHVFTPFGFSGGICGLDRYRGSPLTKWDNFH